MKYKITYYIVLLVLLFGESYSQDPYHIIFDVNDGLPSSEVYDVEIDNQNNLWFSTDRGISRYNGYKFENFSTEHGLTDNTIFEIFKDNKGYLWFSCYDGTVSYYDYDKFREAPFNKKLKPYIIRNWVRQIYFENDSICLFTTGKTTGADKNKCYFKYNFNSDELECIDISEQTEIVKIGNKDSNSFVYIPSKDYYSHLTVSIDDKLFVGLTPEINYMSRDMNTQKHMGRHEFNSSIMLSEKEESRLIFDKKIELVKLYKDLESNLWVVTNKGLILLKKQDDFRNPNTFYKQYSCSSIIEDSENNLWLTTINKGVILIPNIKIKEYDNTHFGDSRVIALESLQNHLYMSTFGGELFSMDKDLKIESIFKIEPGFLELQRYEDDKLVLYDNTIIKESVDKISFLHSREENRIYSKIFLKISDQYFLKTYHNLSWNEVDALGRLQSKRNIITDTRVTCLHKTKDNKIWVGTLEGLYWINDYSKDLNDYNKVFTDKNIGRISTIQESIHDYIYIGTIGQGIFYYDSEKKDINNFKINNENKINIINCLYEENDSTLWIGSNSGLYQTKIIVDNEVPKLEIINHHITRTGLSSNFIVDIAKWNDQIWVATEKGVNIITSNQNKININPPVVYFDSISCNDRLINVSEHTKLDYKENNLSFHFNSNTFKNNPDIPLYKYVLFQDGVESGWNYTNNKEAQFTNLAPGKYKFEVLSRNQDDNWSTIPASFEFTIHSHFSQTLLFKIFLIVSIMFVSYLIYWYRSRQVIFAEMQKRKLQTLEMRVQRAELNALRGQMNPHFIFNALNSIQNFFYKGDEENANYYISKFSKLMRSSLEMSKLELITIEEEIVFLSNYLELEKMRFSDRFEYAIRVEKPEYNFLKIPPLLIQPLVENTIKHGFKNIDYIGEVVIQFSVHQNRLKIEVIDNGNGIEKDKLERIEDGHRSLSIQIIKERILIMNSQNQESKAKIIFAKNKDKGLIVTLDLPIHNS